MALDLTVFAETNFRNQRRKFGIKRDDRRRHVYVVGKTGMGKSTLLENMIIADIRAGEGVSVVDPHGDLAEKILDFIPNNRVNDVIYFNPADTQYPIAFNILESVGPDYKHLVAYGLVGVFKKIWADSWGPRMEYIMTNTILALLDYPGSTLLGLMRMLVDKAYRKKVVTKVMDPVVKTFWADEFANYSEKFRTEAIAPIQNKVGQFLASAIIRNIVGQSKSTIEMREIMDNQKILIMNLAKGRIGEENSALLGAMMITKLQIAAMSRVDVPEESRKDFYLYVDEFQNFATDSFAGILSEARKYRLCLIMAHQYFEQLGDVVKAAVFGNVGTMIVFRVGATDAAELELEFAPQFLPTDIVNLKKYTVCMRLMVDGVATEPFSAIGLPPASSSTSNKDKVVKVSRERYARSKELVEDRIIRWSGVEINRPGQPASTTTPGTAGEDTPEDLGDDMDWPDPVGMQTKPNVGAIHELPQQPIQKISQTDGEVKLEVEDQQITKAEVEIKPAVKLEPASAHVNATGFIPGDKQHQPVGAIHELPQQYVASASTVRIEAEPITQDNVGPRPKISFVKPPQTVGIAEGAELNAEVAEEIQVGAIHELPQRSDAKQNDTIHELSQQQITQPKPPVPASVSPTVSLTDLKQGNVQPIKFGPSQSQQPNRQVGAIHELPQQPSDSPQQFNANGNRPRKRKRNRGGGGGGQAPMGQSPNSNQQPQQSRPPQVQQPSRDVRAIHELPQQSKPVQAQPQRPPVQQQKPQPPSPPKPTAPDPNKISWGDVLQ